MADTGFKSPTATGEDYNQWLNPSNAFSSNDVYANETALGEQQDYYNFTFGVPASATIDGVEVTLEAIAVGTLILNGDAVDVKIDISDDGGTTYGLKKTVSWAVEAGESVQTLGGPTSAGVYWGLTLTDTDFSNTNFRVRVEMDALTGGATGVNLDHIQVKVYYTEAVTGRTYMHYQDGFVSIVT